MQIYDIFLNNCVSSPLFGYDKLHMGHDAMIMDICRGEWKG